MMDNLSAHKGGRVKEILEGAGCELVYLPPYSPDFNPIEQAFSKVKGLVRRAEARTREALIEAMGRALSALSAMDARAFFAHCGYPYPGASTKKGVLKAMAYPLKIDHEVVAFDVNRICSYSEGWVADAPPRLHIEVETMPGTAQHLPVPYQLIDTGLTWCCQRG